MSIAYIIAGARICTDVLYILHAFLEFQMANEDPNSGRFGQAWKIVKPCLDFVNCIPIPEILIWTIVCIKAGETSPIIGINSLYGIVIPIYIYRVFRSLQFLARESATGFMFESIDAISVINFLKLMLAAHVVGSCWYIFGLQALIWTLVRSKAGETSPLIGMNYLYGFAIPIYISRLIRSSEFLARQSPRGFMFDSIRANSVINFFKLILAAHVVGSCWYIFGLQRINQCLVSTCHQQSCPAFVRCGSNDLTNKNNSTSVNPCLSGDGSFNYGIFKQVVRMTAEDNVAARYVHALICGFQELTTLASSLVPSYFKWKGLFMMAIIALRVYPPCFSFCKSGELHRSTSYKHYINFTELC